MTLNQFLRKEKRQISTGKILFAKQQLDLDKLVPCIQCLGSSLLSLLPEKLASLSLAW